MAPENAPSKGGSSVTGFDPEGLERAAKAARELDNSRNAPAAIDLVKTQEATKQVRTKHIYIHTYIHEYPIVSAQFSRNSRFLLARSGCQEGGNGCLHPTTQGSKH
jgi:hypothetical protein